MGTLEVDIVLREEDGTCTYSVVALFNGKPCPEFSQDCFPTKEEAIAYIASEVVPARGLDYKVCLSYDIQRSLDRRAKIIRSVGNKLLEEYDR